MVDSGPNPVAEQIDGYEVYRLGPMVTRRLEGVPIIDQIVDGKPGLGGVLAVAIAANGRLALAAGVELANSISTAASPSAEFDLTETVKNVAGELELKDTEYRYNRTLQNFIHGSCKDKDEDCF